jgi:hypothetical protein
MIDGATKDNLNIPLKKLEFNVEAKSEEEAIQKVKEELKSNPITSKLLNIDIDKMDIKPDGSIDVGIQHVPHSKNNDEPDRYGQHKDQYLDKENGYYIKPEAMPRKKN